MNTSPALPVFRRSAAATSTTCILSLCCILSLLIRRRRNTPNQTSDIPVGKTCRTISCWSTQITVSTFLPLIRAAVVSEISPRQRHCTRKAVAMEAQLEQRRTTCYYRTSKSLALLLTIRILRFRAQNSSLLCGCIRRM